MLERFFRTMTFVFLGIIVCMGLYVAYLQWSHSKERVKLQNESASKDMTIQLKEGFYHKLVLQSDDLRSMLDRKDKQLSELDQRLKASKEELLTTNVMVVGLKKQLEQLAKATQTDVPPAKPGEVARAKVDFHHDFGAMRVDGWTMTNPPQSWVRLSQGRPLKLSLSISQDKDRAWHAYSTVDDPNFAVDIKLTAVNPGIFKPKWYEGFGIMAGLGVGTNQSGLGAMVQLGITYKLRQFTFGPAVWLGLNDSVDKYYGIVFIGNPFEKDR